MQLATSNLPSDPASLLAFLAGSVAGGAAAPPESAGSRRVTEFERIYAEAAMLPEPMPPAAAAAIPESSAPVHSVIGSESADAAVPQRKSERQAGPVEPNASPAPFHQLTTCGDTLLVPEYERDSAGRDIGSPDTTDECGGAPASPEGPAPRGPHAAPETMVVASGLPAGMATPVIAPPAAATPVRDTTAAETTLSEAGGAIDSPRPRPVANAVAPLKYFRERDADHAPIAPAAQTPPERGPGLPTLRPSEVRRIGALAAMPPAEPSTEPHREPGPVPPSLERSERADDLPMRLATAAPPCVTAWRQAGAPAPIGTPDRAHNSGPKELPVAPAHPSESAPREDVSTASLHRGLPVEQFAAATAPRLGSLGPRAEAATFAARSRRSVAGDVGRIDAAPKTEVVPSATSLTKRDDELGIAAAKPVAAMEPGRHSSQHEVTERIPSGAAIGLELPELRPEGTQSESLGDGQVVATAHAAIEVVQERIDAGPLPSHGALQLKFSVAGEELLVRVQWHRDEVRTAFHTDSAELLAALSQEWQASITPVAERPVRLAEPQFARFDSVDADGSMRDGERRERENSADSGREPGLPQATGPVRLRARELPSAVVATLSATVPPRTSRHLRAHA